MRPDARHRRRLGRGALVALAACVSSALPVQAQVSGGAAAHEGPWYRIEVLVVRQLNASALQSESWTVYPQLTYPEQYRFLIDRALADQRLATYPDATSRIDDYGRQTVFPAPSPLTADGSVGADLDASLPLLESATDIPLVPEPPDVDNEVPEDTLSVASLPPTEDPDALLATLQPRPFTLLADTELEFAAEARRMRASGAYEILWHQAWLQPLADEASTPWIIVDRSGDRDQTLWPALQGSLTVYLSRYLHLATDLWLSTNGGYLPEGWSADAPPLAPASLEIWQPEFDDPTPITNSINALLDGELFTLPEAESSLPMPGGDPLAIPGETPSVDELEVVATPRPTVDEAAWPWRHAIRIAATRRMRSAELHYLDHPVLGVLVKATPVDDAALAEWAASMADPAWVERHSFEPNEAGDPAQPASDAAASPEPASPEAHGP